MSGCNAVRALLTTHSPHAVDFCQSRCLSAAGILWRHTLEMDSIHNALFYGSVGLGLWDFSGLANLADWPRDPVDKISDILISLDWKIGQLETDVLDWNFHCVNGCTTDGRVMFHFCVELWYNGQGSDKVRSGLIRSGQIWSSMMMLLCAASCVC